jgi:hypothetical protein
MTIQSGGSNSDKQLVTKKGAAVTASASRSALADAARDTGAAYVWHSLNVDLAADRSVLAVTNDHTTHDLVIHSVSISSLTISEWKIIVQTATFVEAGGTAVVGTNLNGQSATLAQADARSDETANSGGTVVHAVLLGVNTPYTAGPDVWGGALRLAPGQAIIVDQVADVAGAVVTIVGYYELPSRVEG